MSLAVSRVVLNHLLTLSK